MNNYFEIVIFTAATHDYAEWALSYFEEEARSCITHILCRIHARIHNGMLVKDLRLLGRDLKKTIIIDNLCENF